MNRAQVIAKIKAMLSLQESTDFDGEAAAAANLIDKLCKQHGISVDDAVKPEILDEIFQEFKKMNSANATLLSLHKQASGASHKFLSASSF
jgi:enamine deaminase RidA (YjgF/YER057c/UK114 family)